MEMRRKRLRASILAVAAASLLAGGVGAQTGSKAVNPDAGQVNPLGTGVQVPVAVSLKTDKKTYTPNEPIKMTIAVKNPSKSTVHLPFATGQKYDIEIRRGKARNGAKVWQWSHGKMFTMMVSSLPVAPGKTLTYPETYDPAKEKPLTPGTYTLRATITTSGRAPRPYNIATITVK